MLALQSAPFHLDQDKQESRFDQPFLFSAFSSHQHSQNNHIHHLNHPQLQLQHQHQHQHHHPRHHTYHHPPTSFHSSSSAPLVLMPHSHSSKPHHHHIHQYNLHQQHHYRDIDLKQDHSQASTTPSFAAPIARSGALQGETPIAKILNRIARMTVEDYSKEKIVLLLTGSFCPIHLHHTEMLEAAKERMEQELGQEEEGAVILGGFLSPSHDLYVGEKLRGEELVLNSRERLDLCRLQTMDSDWIDVDAWESNQDRFYDYHKVTSRLQQYLQERCHHVLAEKMNALARTHGSHPQIPQHYRQHSLPQHHYAQQQTPLQKMVPQQRPGSLDSKNPFNIRVVYLCGADFVLRTGARKLVGGIVVVDRPLGAPSSNRRSILLTNSGGSISVPVSNQLDKSEEEDALSESGSITSTSSMSSSGTFSTHSSSSSSSISTKHRVFKRLEQSYGSEWCEASRNNVWWLPSRSRTESEDISSTKIRGLLSDRKSCKGLLHPLVAQRLLEKQASLRA